MAASGSDSLDHRTGSSPIDGHSHTEGKLLDTEDNNLDIGVKNLSTGVEHMDTEAKSTSILRPLEELQQRELVNICHNLEGALRNKDQQIQDINTYCDQLMGLYYDTVEKLTTSNRELRSCQDQLRHLQHQNQLGKQTAQPTSQSHQVAAPDRSDPDTRQVAAPDSSDPDTRQVASLESSDPDTRQVAALDSSEPDTRQVAAPETHQVEPGATDVDDDSEDEDSESDSASLVSDETDQELAHMSSSDEEDDDEDDDEDEDGETDSDATRNSTPETFTASPRPVITAHSGLSQSLSFEHFGSELGAGRKLSTPNSAARARRQSRRLASSVQNVEDKFHPVLHRRDPQKSRLDVLKADLVGVDAGNAPRYPASHQAGGNEVGGVHTGHTGAVDSSAPHGKGLAMSHDSHSTVNRISPPPDMSEVSADQEQLLVRDVVKFDIVDGGTANKNTNGHKQIVQELESSPDPPVSSGVAHAVQNSSTNHHGNGVYGSANGEDVSLIKRQPLQSIPPPYPRRTSSKLCSQSVSGDTSLTRPLSRIPTLSSMDLSKPRPVASPRLSLSSRLTGHGHGSLAPVLSDIPLNTKSSPRHSAAPRIKPLAVQQETYADENAVQHALSRTDDSEPFRMSSGTGTMEKDSLEYTTQSFKGSSSDVQKLVNSLITEMT